LGVDSDMFFKRLRIAAVANLAEENKSITFADMAKYIGVKEDEVEEWVILAI
jgi:phage antirepressor YoqD-like protein